MNDLLAQINRLSLRDTKTLSQKGLKASEEVGELAKAILPYEGAHGTNHRIPSRDKVAEECADVMLVVYSIMKGMKLSTEEITRVVQRKTDYWEFLLDNEDKSDLDNLAFEIHITVRDVPSLEAFRQTCAEISVKPIILDLYVNDETIADIMTSSRFIGSTKAVIEHTKAMAGELRLRGYEVVREKIESVPWHPAALVQPPVASAYFEAHFAFGGNSTNVETFSRRHAIHLSRNKMKSGISAVVMGTYRVSKSATTSAAFMSKVDAIYNDAIRHGLDVIKKPHTEYSLFDTNETHDGKWIGADS